MAKQLMNFDFSSAQTQPVRFPFIKKSELHNILKVMLKYWFYTVQMYS